MYKDAIYVMNFMPNDLYEYLKQRVMGNDEQMKIIAYGIWKNVRNVNTDNSYVAENYVLTGPSGTGKTECFRAVRDFFEEHNIDIPVVQIDLSQITETGFKGRNIDTIPAAILDVNKYCQGQAICFLDEADKKIMPTYDSNKQNVNAHVQANLLTLVEGIKNFYEIDDNKVEFDSSRTMFIFSGSFQDARKEKGTNAFTGFECGFSKKVMNETEKKDDINKKVYEEVTLEDMKRQGMEAELAGRINRVINLKRIPENEMKNILLKKINESAEKNEVTVNISDYALDELLEISYTDMGLRKPINKINEIIDDAIIRYCIFEDFWDNAYVIDIESLDNIKVDVFPIIKDDIEDDIEDDDEWEYSEDSAC